MVVRHPNFESSLTNIGARSVIQRPNSKEADLTKLNEVLENKVQLPRRLSIYLETVYYTLLDCFQRIALSSQVNVVKESLGGIENYANSGS